MDRVRVGPVKGLWIATAAFVLSVVLALSGAGAVIYFVTNQSADTQDFSNELRDGLVESCETNGNPLREAVRNQILEQIEERESFDYAKFFPAVPSRVLERLLAEQTEADRKTLKEIAPVDCEGLYP